MFDRMKCIETFRGESGDCFTLIGHANYLFRTGGVCWLVDPRPAEDMLDACLPTLADDLREARFALFTHFHSDHFDRRVIEALGDNDHTWVFPDFMPAEERGFVRDRCRDCVFIREGEELELSGIRVRAFASDHYDMYNGKRYGVPEYGYEVTAHGHRLLFPGDIRGYSQKLSGFPGADLFGHVWLGRKSALSCDADMVRAFSEFLRSAAPKRVFLAHLYDRGRDSHSMWTLAHAEAVTSCLAAAAPDLPVLVPAHGEIVKL